MALSAKLSPGSDELSEREIEELNEVCKSFYELRDWFICEFGGVTCRDVQTRLYGRSFNLMDDEELKMFRESQKEQGRKCQQVTTKVALKVAEILSRGDLH